MVAKAQALALAVLARSGSAAPVSAKDAKALSPSNGTTALAQEGQCECKVDYATQFVFYNRGLLLAPCPTSLSVCYQRA